MVTNFFPFTWFQPLVEGSKLSSHAVLRYLLFLLLFLLLLLLPLLPLTRNELTSEKGGSFPQKFQKAG